MSNDIQPEGVSDPHNNNAKLALWLQQVMKVPPKLASASVPQTTTKHDQSTEVELLLDSDYHLPFYRQLPDFVMALLNNDQEVTLRYAPLLYHLAGCRQCHESYLDLYDAMRAAVQPLEPRPLLGQGTRTLEATPQRMLAHLCRSLINQAEAVLLQARHDGTDESSTARSLLQLALRISTHIGQSNVRRSALHDLIRVATLFEGPATPSTENPTIYSYTPVLTGAGGKRSFGKVTRGLAEASARPPYLPQGQAVIYVQTKSLEGSIVQRGSTLELHLHDLDQALRGQYVQVSVPLGALIEPVHWRGGNPSAVRSEVPVDASGSITIPLGETELQLTELEDYRLLEAMFLLLEVRRADGGNHSSM